MTSIINRIIEIDSTAQKKLDDANRYKQELEKETEDKKKKINQEYQVKAKARIKDVESSEQKAFEEEQKVLLQKEQAAISHLRQIYETHHLKLEQKIFERVLEKTL